MSKYENKALEEAASVFKALSNDNRLKIFLRVAKCCMPGSTDYEAAPAGCCVGDLGKDIAVSPSTLSHHLKELNRSGLVQLERQGQFVRCRVNSKTVAAVHKFLDTIKQAAAY